MERTGGELGDGGEEGGNAGGDERGGGGGVLRASMLFIFVPVVTRLEGRDVRHGRLEKSPRPIESACFPRTTYKSPRYRY